jgi:hypothetical protein
MVLVLLSLLAAHVSGGNDSDKKISNGKDEKQSPTSISLAKTEVARLLGGMPFVKAQDERSIEEDLLAFPELHTMPVPVLVEVSLVPIKVLALLEEVQNVHLGSICPAYTGSKRSRNAG